MYRLQSITARSAECTIICAFYDGVVVINRVVVGHRQNERDLWSGLSTSPHKMPGQVGRETAERVGTADVVK